MTSDRIPLTLADKATIFLVSVLFWTAAFGLMFGGRVG